MEHTTSHPEVRIRHGRQFQVSNDNYFLPNDEREMGRLNDQFQAMKLILGSNYTAPLPKLNSGKGPRDILDVASGSGMWVMEIAREFPAAQVIGMDISKPGLLAQDAPTNASFIIADATRRFPFEDTSFDVVQMRIAPSISERTQVYQEIHRVLRPGGIIQLVEVWPQVSQMGRRPPALDEIDRSTALIGHVYNKDENRCWLDKDGKPAYWSIADQIADSIRQAPSMWVNINDKKISIPVGVWAVDEVGQAAGRLMQRQTVELYSGLRPDLIDYGGMTEDEVDDVIARLAKELEDGLKWMLETQFEFVWAAKV
ncbi:hypothetical protein RSOLAG1IB_08115 [Rhizoctonia solani AG-1 IB]|uniref:Methyltransferase domain-containing protein n=1 Tax=Thanatephorus cucumeris (strain AG1-IB / isolate 7/3/14) TaxID=1108050 RepID=A0A0B7FKQ2_THACB|nr:hypothetical protein RSOLAG1IB_08115 [Rhizoctonia solani AG-1 IB]